MVAYSCKLQYMVQSDRNSRTSNITVHRKTWWASQLDLHVAIAFWHMTTFPIFGRRRLVVRYLRLSFHQTSFGMDPQIPPAATKNEWTNSWHDIMIDAVDDHSTVLVFYPHYNKCRYTTYSFFLSNDNSHLSCSYLDSRGVANPFLPLL
jgi:hypothetical protein